MAYTKGKTFADAGAASDPTKMTEAEVIAADEVLGGSTKNIIRIATDDRALLYAGVGGGFRTLTTDQISGFTNGLSIVKWQNSRSDNSTPSDGKFSDTDIPLFRLAEIYLTRAEAKYRLNGTQDLEDINELRNRAHAARVSAVNLAVLLNGVRNSIWRDADAVTLSDLRSLQATSTFGISRVVFPREHL